MRDALAVLEKFANDLIGNVVPGTVLLGLLGLFFTWPLEPCNEIASSLGFLLFATTLAFGVGHALSATAEVVAAVLRLKFDEDASFQKLDSDGQVQLARQAIGLPDAVALDKRDLRSRLMSSSQAARDLAVRFMNIALLCGGVGTALMVAVAARLYAFFFSPALLRSSSSSLDVVVQSIVLVAAGYLLFRRAREFHRRSFRIPFVIVVEELKTSRAKGAPILP